jgi:hypothetical protein
MWWSQYKRTFLWTQLAVLLIAFQIHRLVHYQWNISGVFFVTMQLGAVLGAMWAVRLKRKLAATSSIDSRVR